MAPPKSDGQQLHGDDAHGNDPHQRPHCVGLRVFSALDLYGSNAAAFLPPLFDEVNSVKHRQD